MDSAKKGGSIRSFVLGRNPRPGHLCLIFAMEFSIVNTVLEKVLLERG